MLLLGWSWYDGVKLVAAQNQKQLFGHPARKAVTPSNRNIPNSTVNIAKSSFIWKKMKAFAVRSLKSMLGQSWSCLIKSQSPSFQAS